MEAAGARILVVEDEPELNALLADQLQREGYSVGCAFDGIEAVATVERDRYDLVILDWMLPKLDGPEILSEFRKHPRCLGTPVIVMSSSDARKDRARMEALGIARYFKKPSDLDEFLKLGAVVREVVEEKSRATEAAPA